jgi:hypothetical protein
MGDALGGPRLVLGAARLLAFRAAGFGPRPGRMIARWWDL